MANYLKAENLIHKQSLKMLIYSRAGGSYFTLVCMLMLESRQWAYTAKENDETTIKSSNM